MRRHTIVNLLISFVFRYAIYKTVAIPILALRITKIRTPQCYFALVLPVLFLISIKNMQTFREFEAD